MKQDLICKDSNDEFYTPIYAIEPLERYLKKNSTIWCPFDTDDSYYVKYFKSKGHKVVNTHIFNGQDFFNEDVPECDYIVSNPPYSLKGDVFARLYEIGKPFAMLVGIEGIFGSKQRFNLFKDNDIEIMYFNKRVRYYKSYEEEKPSSNPPFASAYVCSRILPKQIMLEEIKM